MKIKEVAKLTGLTEKTIRFYEDKGLISPEKEEINGRVFRAYSREDVQGLNLVADMRKLDFSISDIIAMRGNPERIPDILGEYRSRASDELDFKTDVLKRFEQIEFKDISNIEELDRLLREMSVNRPLPVSDTEFEFYKIDGITKEELNGEVVKYRERLSLKFRRKVRNTILLFSAALIVFIILAGFIWKATYYLGYVPSFQNDLKWRAALIPLFILLLCGFLFVFIKVIKFITAPGDEDRAGTALRICRYFVFILMLSFAVGIAISSYSLKSMEKMKTEIAGEVVREWDSMYQMVHYVDMYLASGDTEEGKRLSLYVNQNCYNFSYNPDSLHTKMRDLLLLSYDPAFQELVRNQPAAHTEKLKQMFKELNAELKDICIYIIDKPDAQRADLTRYDISEAAALRERIDNFVNKYGKQAEIIFAG